MIQVDLITGFLGSGKTTFMKQYAKRLMEAGQNIGILLNDYGAVNVDRMLLSDLTGRQCDLEMVAGGCDADCHRRRFKTKLISMGMLGYDRVLIEPSGIFDMDEFFDVLREEPLDRWYQPGNVIAIVEAGLSDNLSETSDYFLASQIAHAGMVVFSKVQEATPEEILVTAGHLNRALQRVQCHRIFHDKEILQRNWEEFTEEDWDAVTSCGYKAESYVKLSVSKENAFSTLYYMNVHKKLPQLTALLKEMMSDPACGNIVRIKGFLPDQEGGFYEVNVTRDKVRIHHVETGQEIFIVIGEDLNQDIIDSYWDMSD